MEYQASTKLLESKLFFWFYLVRFGLLDNFCWLPNNVKIDNNLFYLNFKEKIYLLLVLCIAKSKFEYIVINALNVVIVILTLRKKYYLAIGEV